MSGLTIIATTWAQVGPDARVLGPDGQVWVVRGFQVAYGDVWVDVANAESGLPAWWQTRPDGGVALVLPSMAEAVSVVLGAFPEASVVEESP